MRILSQQFMIAEIALLFAVGLMAQPPQPAAWAVPRVVRVNGSFRPVNGLAVFPVENVSLAIYAEEVGGVALWQETQNVTMDAEGRFSVLLGSTRNEGLPLELFAAGEPRWVGVQFQRPGEVEQPSVLLASVPYALKAVDADTLGGRPASDYMLSPSLTPSSGGAGVAVPATDASVKPARLTPKVTSGTVNYIAKFVSGSDLGNSVMAEANGRIGIGTNAPAAALEIVTTGGGAQFTNTQASSFAFNTFSSPGNASYLYNFGNLFTTSGRYVQNSFLVDAGNILSLSAGSNLRFYTNGSNERMRVDSNGNVGIGTLTPGFTLDVSGDINHSGSLFKGGSYFLHNYGTNNTAVGLLALVPNFTGSDNTAMGYHALLGISIGNENTAIGSSALHSNNDGHRNAAFGYNALSNNTSGGSNIAMGAEALTMNTVGNANIAIGDRALYRNTGGANIAIGPNAGSNNTTGNDNIDIGNLGAASDNNVIRIGDPNLQKIFIAAGIWTSSGVPVLIDQYGMLGTSASSRRYKEDIHDMADVSSNLFKLRPVTFRYKKAYSDGSKPIEYGLIAEEVAEVYPDLVVTNKDGQIETVQYQKLTPMLLNEVQKLRHATETQNNEIDKLRQDAEKQSQQVRLQNETIHSLEARLAVLEALLSNKPSAAPTVGQ